MDKLISQQAAIDTLKELTANGTNKGMIFGEDAVHRIEMLPSIQPERKDAIEKAVAVEAISDELMSRFDVSATYGYDFAEAVINRIEAMAKELEKGEQE